ncbi:MAG: glycosyltransferase family 4 protein [Armatimonadota bacterium]|jgi:glycosyltransferase involved in cell wall biosynthesis
MKIGMIGVKAVPGIGGIAAYTEEVGSRLVQRGHSVTVYCRPRFLEADHAPTYRGMERRVSWGISSQHLDALTHTFSSVLSASRDDFDVLHFHGVGPAALMPLARGISSAKIVATIHGFEWQSKKWGMGAKACLRATDRVCLNAADALTVVSAAMLDRYSGRDGQRVAFVPTGVSEPIVRRPHLIRDLGLSGGDYVLFLGRLVPEKGCHHLVSAYKQIRTDMRLVVAGAAVHGGRYESALRNLADDRVIFTGYVNGDLKHELLSNAYLLAQPSELEGLPVSVLEAMSYGRFVLASDIANNREAMGQFGLTFRSGDVEDLQEKLTACLDDPTLVRSQALDVAKWVLTHRSWDRAVDQIERLYAEVLHQRGPLGAEANR